MQITNNFMRNMLLRTLLPLIFALVFLVMPLAPAIAAETSANITVNVTVAPVAEITVVPYYLNWTNIYPGYAGAVQAVDVKNTGSLNVSNIYIYASTLDDETTRPYGTGDPSKYSAAGVIVVKGGSDNVPKFIGRIEWNWTDAISAADFSYVTNVKAWGFYKNTSFEYVWAVGADPTTNRCNDTGAIFAISDIPDDGTTVARTPTTTGISRSDGDANFGYFSISGRAAFGNEDVCVAVASDCSKIYIYRYDKRPGFGSCGNSAYLATSTLVPGDIYRITYISAYVPKGIPAGQLKLGTLTVVASY
jgi:hypothetical protein